jgi:hypothetical protein
MDVNLPTPNQAGPTQLANNKHNNCSTWAYEVYHYTTMRKTLGVTIHIRPALKLICIQANKTFKIKNFPQALKVQ